MKKRGSKNVYFFIIYKTLLFLFFDRLQNSKIGEETVGEGRMEMILKWHIEVQSAVKLLVHFIREMLQLYEGEKAGSENITSKTF
jgi:hypothetical protein